MKTWITEYWRTCEDGIVRLWCGEHIHAPTWEAAQAIADERDPAETVIGELIEEILFEDYADGMPPTHSD